MEAELKALDAQLDFYKLRAPIAGQLGLLQVMPGQTIPPATSVAEVIEQSGLSTFMIEGRDVRRLQHELEGKPGVDYAGFFGAALHVSGRDREELKKTVSAYQGRSGLTVAEVAPSLEDVFIQLMDQAQDNFAPDSPP